MAENNGASDDTNVDEDGNIINENEDMEDPEYQRAFRDEFDDSDEEEVYRIMEERQPNDGWVAFEVNQVTQGQNVYPLEFAIESEGAKGHCKNILAGTNQASQFLDLMFDQAIMQRFVDHTNSFARNKRRL
jgi:hypothetical protein